MDKIVFLDIDGVLNYEKTVNLPPVKVEEATGLPFRQWGYAQFDPKCVERLNWITDSIRAKIVISSTWRVCSMEQFERIVAYFDQVGITGKVIGRTPSGDSYKCRGEEIQAWLDLFAVDKFVIIDDDNDMEHLTPFLVQTTWDEGLQDEHVTKAIEILAS
jgi:hypothetical protein